MTPDETYQLLRTITSPVVAVTSRRGDKLNGMISDGAIRASIVPDIPRLGVFIHKFNFSHDLIHDSGCFAVHLLHTGQVELVQRLGFESGRDRDKLSGLRLRPGAKTGVPILEDCYGWFECRVGNVMDTGSSTFFLGEVVDSGRGTGGDIMEPAYLRANLPAERQAFYQAHLKQAQDTAREASRHMRSIYNRK